VTSKVNCSSPARARTKPANNLQTQTHQKVQKVELELNIKFMSLRHNTSILSSPFGLNG